MSFFSEFQKRFSGQGALNIQVVPIPAIRVVMLRHTGPYDEVSAVFDQLFAWVNSQKVPAKRTIGIYWDNPDFVASRQLRSAACVEIPASFVLSDKGGLPLEIQTISGGEYATTTFTGPYEDLAPVWSKLTRYIERNLRREISANPAFEVYVNDASDTPPEQLITELYMPVV